MPEPHVHSQFPPSQTSPALLQEAATPWVSKAARISKQHVARSHPPQPCVGNAWWVGSWKLPNLGQENIRHFTDNHAAPGRTAAENAQICWWKFSIHLLLSRNLVLIPRPLCHLCLVTDGYKNYGGGMTTEISFLRGSVLFQDGALEAPKSIDEANRILSHDIYRVMTTL